MRSPLPSPQHGVLRVKGYAEIAGKAARVWWFRRSAGGLSAGSIQAPRNTTGLVVIGLKDFDQEAIKAKLA